MRLLTLICNQTANLFSTAIKVSNILLASHTNKNPIVAFWATSDTWNISIYKDIIDKKNNKKNTRAPDLEINHRKRGWGLSYSFKK